MSTWQARIYWALVGIVVGVGIVTGFSIGIPLVLLGAILLIYPASKKMMPADKSLPWIAVSAMGFAPAALLTFDYLASDQTTTSYPSGYWPVVLFLAALGLAGIAGSFITTARRLPR